MPRRVSSVLITTARCLLPVLCLLLHLPASLASEALAIHINDEVEINLEVFKGKANYLYIWQPHEAGTQAIDRQLAEHLSQAGVEVWLVDLLESYFLSNTASNMDRLSGDGYAAILEQANKAGKIIIIGASGRGAIPVLRGIRQWQEKTSDHSLLAGLILLSPKLYVETPQPGSEAMFMPIAEATNLPVYLLQPNQSPWFWKLNNSITALSKGGSEVYLKPLDKLRDRFYFRPDATEYEQQATKRLWQELSLGIITLLQQPRTYRKPARIETSSINKQERQERRLLPYQGDPSPPPLRLADLTGKLTTLDDFKGKVVLVNFWATWCPPCVHEMPSMQRLSEKFATKPFAMLGVNMAETRDEVTNFLTTRVRVDFPIVLDSQGKALKDWGVFAFPTSYVLDKKGKIRLALFGGVEWDQPEIYQPILELINEQDTP